jgi:5,5'-dehydrodivanillate O-demethylase
MLTAEENEYLTRVGPGTSPGELLRRYWHPVAIARRINAGESD